MAENGSQDPRVASLEEARRRKADQEKAEKRAAAATGGAPTLGQRVYGVAMIAMAIGLLIWLAGGFGGAMAPETFKP